MRLLFAMLALMLPQVVTAIVPLWAENLAEHPSRPIVTKIRYANGDEQLNRGTGFVVGSRFYTAYHNIQTSSAKVSSLEIAIGGIAVEPTAVDVAHDLAVFEVPQTLCPTWCNNLAFAANTPGSAGVVAWMRLEGKRQIWKHGRVVNVAFKSVVIDSPTAGCENNLIVEIDQPFIPGSSGGPVFDASSGVIIGLIQGSFQTRSGKVTGYYKPVQCVLSRLDKMQLTRHR